MKRDTDRNECPELYRRAFSIKKRFLAMYHRAHAGHIGSSLSCTEMLVLLHFSWMGASDTFVLSKGHAAGALYSLLAELGVLSQAQLDTFYDEGTYLPALPPFNAIEGIPFATGALGYGLSLCAGMALGAQLKGESKRFFCVTSDGELNEGSVWEAALFIRHRSLQNVVWLIDRNRIQAIGRTEDVLALEPLDQKLRAFGFHVLEADGHNFEELLATRDECERLLADGAGPVVIIAHTVKGNGISFMHNTVDSHYQPMSPSQYEQALSELTQSHLSQQPHPSQSRVMDHED